MAIYTSDVQGGISISFPNVREGEVENISGVPNKAEDFPPFRLEGPPGPPPDEEEVKRKRFDPSMVKGYPDGGWDINTESYNEDDWHAFGNWHEKNYGNWPGFLTNKGQYGEHYDDLKKRMDEYKSYQPAPKMNEAPSMVQKASYVPDRDTGYSRNLMPKVTGPGIPLDLDSSVSLSYEQDRVRTRDYETTEGYQEWDRARAPEPSEASLEATNVGLGGSSQKPQDATETLPRGPTYDSSTRIPTGEEVEAALTRLEQLKAEAEPGPNYKEMLDQADAKALKLSSELVQNVLAMPPKVAQILAHVIVQGAKGAWALASNPPRGPEDIEGAVKPAADFASAYTLAGYARNFRTGAMGAELAASGGKIGPGRLGLITDKSEHIIQREPKLVEEAMTKLKSEAQVLELNKDIPQIKARVDGIMNDMAAIDSILPSREMMQRALRDIRETKESLKQATGGYKEALELNLVNAEKIAKLLDKQIDKGTEALARHSSEVMKERVVTQSEVVKDQPWKSLFDKEVQDLTPQEALQALTETRDKFLLTLKNPKLSSKDAALTREVIEAIEKEILSTHNATTAADLKAPGVVKPGKPANDNAMIADASLTALDQALIAKNPELGRLNNAFNEAYAKNPMSKETTELGKKYSDLKSRLMGLNPDDPGFTLGVGGGRLTGKKPANWMDAKSRYTRSSKTREDLEQYVQSLKEAAEQTGGHIRRLQSERADPKEIHKVGNLDKQIRDEWSKVMDKYHTYKPKASEIDRDVVKVFKQQYEHMTEQEIVDALYAPNPTLKLPDPPVLEPLPSDRGTRVDKRTRQYIDFPADFEKKIISRLEKGEELKGSLNKPLDQKLYEEMKKDHPEVEMSIGTFRRRFRQVKDEYEKGKDYSYGP